MMRSALLFVLLFFVGTPSQAAAVADLEALRQQAASFLRQQLPEDPAVEARIEVPPLDHRLRLTRCAHPVELFLPAGRRPVGATSVGLRCRAPKPWTVYVPARVQLSGPVLVASRPLPRGKRIERDDFQIEHRDLSRLRGDYLTRAEHLLGQVLTRPIAPGRPFRAQFLRPPSLVERGERVTLVARGGGLEVRMQGEALEDAALGESVRVRNLRSKRVVQGRVSGRGVVEVGL